MSEAVKLNLRQKLASVYTKLDHVEKSGTNSKQNYKFVKSADMLRAMRNAFAELGIYAETNYDLLGTYDIKTNSGGTMHTATVKATIKLYDCDSDETMTISGLGDGADSGDKGIYKAQTGSTKNALRNGSLMPDEGDPTGGDPEGDETVDRQTDPDNFRPAPRREPVELPDFHDEPSKRAPRPTPAPAASGATNVTGRSSTSPAAPVAAPSTPAQEPAGDAVSDSPRGDAYEGPDDDRLPTEEELNGFRSAFSKLGDDLTTNGKLKSSKGMPVNAKLKAFLLHITGAPDPKKISKAKWDDFFKRVEKVKGTENGMIGLTKLVNNVNGIEEK